MSNELIFFFYAIFTAASALTAARISREALIAFIAVLFVVMNLFVIKQVHLLGYNATASDALGVAAAFSFALLQEFHGPKIVKKTITYATGISLFYVISSLFHLAYTPSPSDHSQVHFEFLLSPAPRILAASLVTGIIVQWIQAHFFILLTRLFSTRLLALRNFISVATMQLLDVSLFATLGLWGQVESLGEIIMVGYILKIIATFLMSSVLSLAKSVVTFPSSLDTSHDKDAS
jgi:uncharacterized integral membrane protein (TIGR00697 family)